ncbi:IS3 family transposase [Allokutzneria albata]|uniref:IS3 family transposase n=1 Tax=Allokutzneria albata TaxID=211114 RepID=UPI0009DD4F48|nr:IS3 family transposase [Allokutzneria albata]
MIIVGCREPAGTIKRVHEDNYGVYGARKIWAELHRQGVDVARCTVERHMRESGLRGLPRDKSPRTTQPAAETSRPGELAKGDFTATRVNELWVAGHHPRAHCRRLGLRGVRARCLLLRDRGLAGRHQPLHGSGAQRRSAVTSVGSKGDSSDNEMAEAFNSL